MMLDTLYGYSGSNPSVVSNFSSGLYNDHSNKKFLVINDVDSIYIFSSRLSDYTDAFYYAVEKQGLSSIKKTLSSAFPQGYLLNAVKSAKEKSIAYIAGVTGQGGFPTIIKLNYKTNTVLWKYTSVGLGGCI